VPVFIESAALHRLNFVLTEIESVSEKTEENMLGVLLIVCGEVASVALLSYGAYLFIRNFDIVRGETASRLANDDTRFLRSPVLQEPAKASAWPPSRARSFPGAAGDEPAVPGAFSSVVNQAKYVEPLPPAF
jgi:hypothetical protein